jgi:hypothetical protein
MKKRIFTGILLILIGYILMSTVTTVSADGGLFIPFRYFLTKLRRKTEETKNKLNELRLRSEEREKQIEDREKQTSRFWKERAVYIAVIIGSVSILLTIIMMR